MAVKVSLWKAILRSPVIWLVLGMPLLFILFAMIPAHFGASEGVHRGVITAVEYNSNVIWPATIVYIKTSAESTQEDKYCVNDETVKNQLLDLSKTRKESVIYYKNNFVMWKSECNGGESIIYKVEEAKP